MREERWCWRTASNGARWLVARESPLAREAMRDEFVTELMMAELQVSRVVL